MTDVLETAGRYRLRLVADEHPENPRTHYDHITHVITPEGQNFIDVDTEGGPLQYGWDWLKNRKDAVAVFTRWARIAHGAVVVEVSPAQGARALWYMMPDGIKETPDPVKYIEAEAREYEAWAEGDVWIYDIERSVVWQRTETAEDESMITWEGVESCGGYYGREYAEQEARAAFEAYKTEGEKA